MMRTYKFKLEPTKEQIEKIEWTLGMCRWLYNSMLEQRKFAFKRRGITLNYNRQAIELPELKREIPELKEIHSQVLQDAAKRLDKAFQAFFRRVERGEKPGYPRFHGRNRYDSFTYPQSGHGFKLDGKYLKLSKIGDVRIKMHRQIEGRSRLAPSGGKTVSTTLASCVSWKRNLLVPVSEWARIWGSNILL